MLSKAAESLGPCMTQLRHLASIHSATSLLLPHWMLVLFRRGLACKSSFLFASQRLEGWRQRRQLINDLFVGSGRGPAASAAAASRWGD